MQSKSRACRGGYVKFETLFVENKFHGSKTCRKIRARFKSRSIDTKSQGESWAHRRRITIKDRDKNYRLDLQLKVQETLGLSLDPTFYNSKCWIKEIQNSKGLAKLYQWFIIFLPIAYALTKMLI